MQLSANKFYKLAEMDKIFHERHKLPNFTQGEIDNMNHPMPMKKNNNWTCSLKLSQEETAISDITTGEFYQITRKEILHKLFQKGKKEGVFPNFYKASITQILKSDKDLTRKRYINILLEHR